jgi:hypothetical protein
MPNEGVSGLPLAQDGTTAMVGEGVGRHSGYVLHNWRTVGKVSLP